jgi:lysozyme
MLDLENGMKTDDTYNAHWALTWLETVESELGHKPICYTARWAEDMYLVNADKALLEELKEYPVWVASYNSGIEPERPSRIWSGWNVWQYTGSGAVPGVEGNCDKNWMSGGMLDYLRMY